MRYEHYVAGVYFGRAFREHTGFAVFLNYAFEVFSVFAGGAADVYPVAVEHVVSVGDFEYVGGLEAAGSFSQ